MAILEKASFGHAESKLNALRILANISLEHMHLLLSHCSDQTCDKKLLWGGEFLFLAYFLSEYSPAWCTALWIWQLLVHILVDQKAEKRRRVARRHSLRPIP